MTVFCLTDDVCTSQRQFLSNRRYSTYLFIKIPPHF